MANRLSKIVTKTGDDGTTGLSGNKRVSKGDAIITAIGAIDELNSAIGLARVVCEDKNLDDELQQIQQELFNCGGDLCLDGSVLISTQQIETLEKSLQSFNSQLQALKNFILPTGSELTARIHMARSICRRAECGIVKAGDINQFNPLVKVYINRLSDWLFVIARVTNESKEVLWC